MPKEFYSFFQNYIAGYDAFAPCAIASHYTIPAVVSDSMGVQTFNSSDSLNEKMSSCEFAMTYAISNTEGDHLGFVLLSGGPDAGDCLIRALPADSEHVDTPEAKFLFSLQHMGELCWERVKDEFRIAYPRGDVILIEKDGRMTGSGFVFYVEAVT